MLDDRESREVVNSAVFQAGGFLGPHPDSRTLTQAGLATAELRRGFQPAVADEVTNRNHDIGDVSRVPNGAGTTIAQAADFVKKNASQTEVP
jgi:hypothetical protein